MDLLLRLLFFAACSAATPVLANIGVEIYCFTSGDRRPVRFEMREYTDSTNLLSAAFVRYEKSKSWIPLILQARQSEMFEHATQAETTVTWLEITNSNPSGTYEMVSQGALVNSMRYISHVNRKQYDFFRDTGVEFSVDKGCEWSRR